MDQDFKVMVDRYKEKANIFFREDVRAFIKDLNDTWYFCNIVNFNEDYLEVRFFAGKKKGETAKIYWVDIVKFEQYREVKSK